MEPQPSSSMRRTPPGGPGIAIAYAEPEEPLSWLQRVLLWLRGTFRRAA